VAPGDGITATIRNAERWLWRRWLGYWDWIAELKQELDAYVTSLCVGDAVDKNRKGHYGLVSQNEAIIIDMGCAAWEPVQAVSDLDIIVRGTDTHTGEQAHLEELFASAIDAAKNEQGLDAWPFAEFRANRVGIYAAHKPETHGTLWHTEGPGIARNKAYFRAAMLDAGRDVPDVALFGHYHRPLDTGDLFGGPRMIFLPSFQLTSHYYAVSMGRAHRVAPVGGIAVICRGGKFEVREKTFLPANIRRKPWSIEDIVLSQPKRT